MKCPEKEHLQRECSAAWDAYAAQVRDSGAAPSISGLMARRWYTRPGSATEDALRLRGEHMKESRELSRHLARHRC